MTDVGRESSLGRAYGHCLWRKRLRRSRVTLRLRNAYRLRTGVANDRSRLLPRATGLCGRSWSEPQLSVQRTHAPSGHHRQARVGSETGSFIGMRPGLEPQNAGTLRDRLRATSSRAYRQTEARSTCATAEPTVCHAPRPPKPSWQVLRGGRSAK
jgi:hypothetical protein